MRSLNSSFLVLISKCKGAEDLKDFKLICLVGSLYKLLSKVLANRLKRFNKAQNAFVEGRQILYPSLMANEIIDSIEKKKESDILCNLDIEKVYEYLN